MRITCTLSAGGELAFWLLLIGLVLGFGIGHAASSADFESAAAAARRAGSAAPATEPGEEVDAVQTHAVIELVITLLTVLVG
jgi:hypothetical protein